MPLRRSDHTSEPASRPIFSVHCRPFNRQTSGWKAGRTVISSGASPPSLGWAAQDMPRGVCDVSLARRRPIGIYMLGPVFPSNTRWLRGGETGFEDNARRIDQETSEYTLFSASRSAQTKKTASIIGSCLAQGKPYVRGNRPFWGGMRGA